MLGRLRKKIIFGALTGGSTGASIGYLDTRYCKSKSKRIREITLRTLQGAAIAAPIAVFFRAFLITSMTNELIIFISNQRRITG